MSNYHDPFRFNKHPIIKQPYTVIERRCKECDCPVFIVSEPIPPHAGGLYCLMCCAFWGWIPAIEMRALIEKLQK